MSAVTDDLRERLERAFAASWTDEREYGDAIDALMPTVREALARAWDDGHAVGSEYGQETFDRNPWLEQP